MKHFIHFYLFCSNFILNLKLYQSFSTIYLHSGEVLHEFYQQNVMNLSDLFSYYVMIFCITYYCFLTSFEVIF
jgi:hypothetical protein